MPSPDSDAFSDLWRVGHGRVVLAKVLLLAFALLLGARHLLVVPKRLRTGRRVSRSDHSNAPVAPKLGALVVTVALAAALVAMVPGRSLALAASGEVNLEHTAGSCTPSSSSSTHPGREPTRSMPPSSTVKDWPAAEVVNTNVAFVGAWSIVACSSGDAGLISPGHFVGDVTLPVPGASQGTVSPRLKRQPRFPSTFAKEPPHEAPLAHASAFRPHHPVHCRDSRTGLGPRGDQPEDGDGRATDLFILFSGQRAEGPVDESGAHRPERTLVRQLHPVAGRDGR